MTCPKCKAKIGVMRQVIFMDTGTVDSSRCIICGYLASKDHLKQHKKPSKRKQKGTDRPDMAA
ncbi:hypothetical protein GSbR_12970 [Geobacter sp. SVR]|nr:hypothetical protein GSVR_42420 [Geobacter sp. SVR]GCF84697.1 hypothetical protein GSbR_12970 [Geobacter sp. SVR]